MKKKEKQLFNTQSAILFLALLILLIQLGLNTNILSLEHLTSNVVTSGEINICINHPPTLNLSACDSEAEIDAQYSCTAGSDQDNQTLNFTDNTSLFNINQTSGLIQFTPTSEQEGTYSITITATDNSTCSNNQTEGILNITVGEPEEEPEEPEPTTTSGGGGRATPPSSNFEISPETLEISMKTQEIKEKTITITNTGFTTLNISIQTTLSELITFSQSNFLLPLTDSKEIILTLSTTEAGVYSDNLIFSSPTLEKTLPILIEVEEKEMILDLKLELDEQYKQVQPGGEISAKISLFNLGETKPISILLNYYIKDIQGNKIMHQTETTSIQDGKSFTKTITLPDNINYQNYIFYVEATSQGSTAVSGEIFEVTKEKYLETPIQLTSQQILNTINKLYTTPAFIILLIITLLILGLIAQHHLTLKKIPQIHQQKIKELHTKLKRDTINKQNREQYKKKLQKHKSTLDLAHKLKHITTETHKKAQKDLDKLIKKL